MTEFYSSFNFESGTHVNRILTRCVVVELFDVKSSSKQEKGRQTNFQYKPLFNSLFRKPTKNETN